MCGITGVVSFNPKKIIRESQLRRMTDEIAHRGPDDNGIYLNENKQVGLGFRRLAIIDLSENGHQPMTDQQNRAWIVFNGEIYNFIEIRNELLSKGYTFKSHSDSEVLLNSYLEWGHECVNKLNGMFAFAIWNTLEKELFIARDHVGIKPLYYTIQPDYLAFASELKSLTMIPELDLQINLHSIWNYLTLLQISAPETIYTSINKLLPGHAIIVKDNECKFWNYWKPEFKINNLISYPEIEREVIQKLRKSVERNLISDVPVGVFLSGGIDSSAVVALASEFSDSPVKTFSVRFSDDPEIDEGEFQKIISNKFKTEHHEFHVKPDILDAVELILRETDEPFAVSSAIPLYYISKMASNHVKVVLSGDGSDEIFGGYTPRYNKAIRAEKFDFVPPCASKPAASIAYSIYSSIPNNRTIRQINRLLSLSQYDKNERYLYSFGYFTHVEKLKLFNQEKLNGLDKSFGDHYKLVFSSAPSQNPDYFYYIDLMTALGDEMLTKSDRCTSMVSIEGRVPFLDRELIEFALTIPSKYKSNSREGKIVLKSALKNILPDQILSGKKRGFNIPMDRLITENMTKIENDLIYNPQPGFLEIFRTTEIKKILNLHMNHDPFYGHHIWTLLQLNTWFRIRNEAKVNQQNETLFL